MMMRSAVLAAGLFVASCGQQKPEAPKAPSQSPAPARKTLTAEVRDDCGQAKLTIVARAVGEHSIEQALMDQPSGESGYTIKTSVVSMTMTIDGKPVDWLPADGLYDPSAVTLAREGQGFHARVEGGDAHASYFCDYFIVGARVTRRECGSSEIGQPGEITTYIEQTLE